MKKGQTALSQPENAHELSEQSEDQFKALFQKNPAAIGVIRMSDGRFTDINESFLRLSEYKRQDIIGRSPVELNMYFNSDKCIDLCQEMREKKTCDGRDLTIRTKSGKLRFVLVFSDIVYLNNEESLIVTTIDLSLHKMTEEILQKTNENLEKQVEESLAELERSNKKLLEEILERKRAEVVLHQNERIFDTLVQNLPGFVYRCSNDRNWTMEYVSSGVLTLTGYGQEDLIDNKIISYSALILPEYREKIWKKWQELLIQHKYFEDTYPIRGKSGEIKWVWERGRGIFDDGQLLYIEGYVEDFTEHHKATTNLRSRESQLSTALKIAKMGYWEYDVESNIFTFNEQFYNIFRSSVEKEGGISMTPEQYSKRFVHPDEVDVVGDEIRRMLNSKEEESSRDMEHRIIYADGCEGYITVRFFIIRDLEGNIVRTYGVNQDITERKKMEEAHLLSEFKFQSIFNNTEVGILVKNSKGIITDVNPAAERIFGFKKEKFPDPATVIKNPGTIQENGSIFPASEYPAEVTLRTGKPVRNSVMGIWSPVENSYRWINVTATPHFKGANYKPDEVYITFNDITEQKREKEVRETLLGFMSIVNSSPNKIDLIKKTTQFIKNFLKCDAVGIRLQEGDDFPYFETIGFPEEFIKMEKYLCGYNSQGQVERNREGNPILECMCGNILCNRFDPSKSFFTEHGSFWSNCTTELLTSTTEVDRQARTRNRCNGEGYESVGLFPIRLGSSTFGLLQVNHKQKNLFNKQLLSILERFGDILAMALMQHITHEELLGREKLLSSIYNASGDAIFLLTFQSAEKYIFTSVNKAFYSTTGLPSDSVVGKFVDDVIPEPSLTLVLKKYRQAIHENTIVRWVETSNYPNGQLIGEVTIAPIFNDEGECTHLIGNVHDITEIRNAEKSLEESRAKYQLLIENAREAIYVIRNGIFLFVNRMAKEITGLDESEILGKSILDFSPDEDQKEVEEHHYKLLSGELKESNREYRIKVKDGRILWMSVNAVRIIWDGEAATLNFASDITKRKLAEESLRISEARHKMYSEITSDYVYEIDVDPDGNIKMSYVSESFKTTTGRSIDEIATFGTMANVFHPDDFPRMVDFTRSLISSRQTNEIECRTYTKDNQIRWVNIIARPKWDDLEQRVVSIIGAVRDINKRKFAEENLRENEEKFRAYIEHSPVGIFVVDESGNYRECNYAACDIIGYSRSELLSMNIPQITTDEEMKKVLEGFDSLKEKGWLHLETSLRRKDGSIVPIILDAVRLPKNMFIAYCTDLTELKHTEENLLKERNLLLTLMDNIPDNIYFKDLECRFTNVNPSLIHHFGLNDQSEIIGKTDFDFFTEEHARQAYEDEKSILRSGNPIVGKEEKETWPDGRVSWYSTTKMPLRNLSGEILGTFGVSRDISERKNIELAIGREKNFTDMLIESLPGLFYMFDSNLQPVRWNKNKEEFLGITPKEMKTHQIIDSIAETDKGKLIESVKKTMTYGEASDEINIIRYDGKVFPYQLTGKRLDTPDGPMLIGVGIDLSERKQAEQALKESEEKYRNLIEQTSDGVAILNSKGDFLDVNSGLCKISGYTREDLVGMNMKDTAIESGREDQKERYSRVLAGENMIWERQFIKKDGSLVTVEINEKTNADGRIFAFYRDITERKRAELEHMRLQNLESLGLLAGGIAHDFNNLLSSVVGHVSMLLDENLEDEVRESLELIERAARRAIGLTGQLLTFAKGGVPTKKILDLRKLIKDTTNFSLSGSNIEPEFKFNEVLKVDADQGQIAQVIQNLVINAQQAMPSGGKIIITVADYEDPLGRKFVKMSFIDQGDGIPKEIVNKIFDPYFTTKEKGNGLGLAVCHSIITRHEGTINVDSEVGKGTTFDILLPSKKDEIKIELNSRQRLDKRLNILIMDDDSEIRDLLSNMLIKQGHRVTSSKEGKECIDLYKNAKEKGENFDLVFMDLTVKGGIGGKEAVKILKEFDKDAKVIVSSGYAETAISRYSEDGFDGMLKKPYTKSELINVIVKIMDFKK